MLLVTIEHLRQIYHIFTLLIKIQNLYYLILAKGPLTSSFSRAPGFGQVGPLVVYATVNHVYKALKMACTFAMGANFRALVFPYRLITAKAFYTWNRAEFNISSQNQFFFKERVDFKVVYFCLTIL